MIEEQILSMCVATT